MTEQQQPTNSRVLRERAERIIAMNRYMTLATIDDAGPWVAPVAYVIDQRGDFYWASRRDARHSRSLELGSSAAIAVFDSTADYVHVDGLQAAGHGAPVAVPDLDRVFGLYVSRFPMYADLPRDQLTGGGQFRLYRLSPRAMYLLDMDTGEGDRRLPVDLPLR